MLRYALVLFLAGLSGAAFGETVDGRPVGPVYLIDLNCTHSERRPSLQMSVLEHLSC